MGEPMVEFKWLDAKSVGSDVVVFRLEDGATVKARVNVDRVGVALNFKNPDGSSHYTINASLAITIIPPEGKFSIPRSQVQAPAPPKPPDIRHVS